MFNSAIHVTRLWQSYGTMSIDPGGLYNLIKKAKGFFLEWEIARPGYAELA
jgi:hypothetical protein